MDIITIYWILFLVGLGFAVISAITVGFGTAMGGHGVDFSGTHGLDIGHGADTSGLDGGAQGDFHPQTGDFYHGEGEVA